MFLTSSSTKPLAAAPADAVPADVLHPTDAAIPALPAAAFCDVPWIPADAVVPAALLLLRLTRRMSR